MISQGSLVHEFPQIVDLDTLKKRREEERTEWLCWREEQEIETQHQGICLLFLFLGHQHVIRAELVIKDDQVLLMVSTPEHRRERENGRTHSQKMKGKTEGSNSNGKKREKPHYNLNNVTHQSEITSTSTKVMLDNETLQRWRPSLLNTFRRKCISETSTRLALLEESSFLSFI